MHKSLEFTILRKDDDKHLVFGIFNMSTKRGEPFIDSDDDFIKTENLEKAAYEFVLKSRVASDSHKRMGVGVLVESMVFTAEKAATLEAFLKAEGAEATIKPDSEFWFGGFYVADPEVWALIKTGQYQGFSIGGEAHRMEGVA